MTRHTEGAWKRAMKVQEVILQGMTKKITWWQAAEIIGFCDRRKGSETASDGDPARHE